MTESELRQCLATPPDLFQVLDAEFEFQIDVCAVASNTKCPLYITPEMDAFKTPWVYDDIYRCWCNPGFHDPLPWVTRAYEQAQRSPDAVVCVLGLLTAAPWLSCYCEQHADQIRTLYPRPNFIPPPGIKASTNAKDNVLVVFRRKMVTRPAQRFTQRWK